MKRNISILIISLMVLSCSSHKNKHKKDTSIDKITYSPNAEPLSGGELGKLTCKDALTTWFKKLSTNHNDKIPYDVFIADAISQFHRMDIDKNGYLLSEEVDRFRAPYRQDPINYKAEKIDPEVSENKQSEHKNGHWRNKGEEQHNKVLFTEDADPVMSADKNLDFKVTLEEFVAYSKENFDSLENNHDRVIKLDKVISTCGK